MALITTSHKTNQKAIELALTLGKLLPNAEFERRGTKTINQLVQKARKKGHSKIVLITKNVDTALLMQFITLDEDDWQWEEKTIPVKRFEIKKETIENHELQANQELSALFGFESKPSETKLQQKNNKICFCRDKQKILEIIS